MLPDCQNLLVQIQFLWPKLKVPQTEGRGRVWGSKNDAVQVISSFQTVLKLDPLGTLEVSSGRATELSKQFLREILVQLVYYSAIGYK